MKESEVNSLSQDDSFDNVNVTWVAWELVKSIEGQVSLSDLPIAEETKEILKSLAHESVDSYFNALPKEAQYRFFAKKIFPEEVDEFIQRCEASMLATTLHLLLTTQPKTREDEKIRAEMLTDAGIRKTFDIVFSHRETFLSALGEAFPPPVKKTHIQGPDFTPKNFLAAIKRHLLWVKELNNLEGRKNFYDTDIEVLGTVERVLGERVN